MPQTLTDTFHAIVDMVSCIMHYGFDILADVFGYYCGIIGLKFQLKYLLSRIFCRFVAHSQSKRLQT